MVRAKERHLLVTVEVLDASEILLNVSGLHEGIRDAVHRHASGVGGSHSNGDAAIASLQTKHYAPHAQLALVRVPLSQCKHVRQAIDLVKFAQQRPVRLSVVRAFGNAVLARRELARRLEETLRISSDARVHQRLRSTLQSIEELQRC